MKTPQRPFVVEIKSGRRRLIRPSNSIWGDTDVKSLVLEEEAAHFSARLSSTLAASIENARADVPQPMPEAEIASDTDGVQQIAAPISQETVRQRQSHNSTAHDDASDGDSPTKRKLARQKHKKLKKLKIPSVAAKDDLVFASVQFEPDSVNRDVDTTELALLASENLRLKRSLAEQLIVENQLLVAMLGRFDLR